MKNFILLFFVGLLITGCVQKQDTKDDKYLGYSIEDFVKSFNISNTQPPTFILDIPDKNVKVFKVSYGAPQDCESGCFYRSLIGIKNKEKIGWIHSDLPSISMYDFDSRDEYLFSDDFFSKLKNKDDWTYQYAFLPSLAKDSDAPDEVLLKIANSLSEYIQPSLAQALLENPKVKSNKKVLTIIANLPVFQGDAYKEVRSKAKLLLES